MNALTPLTKEQKLRSLLYSSNNEMSRDPQIKAKQFEMLKMLYDTYFIECDYFNYYTCIKKTKEYNEVYTFHWKPEKLTLAKCDEILNGYKLLNEKFRDINSAMIRQIGLLPKPTIQQIKFSKCFFNIVENWEDKTGEEFAAVLQDQWHTHQIISMKYYNDSDTPVYI